MRGRRHVHGELTRETVAPTNSLSGVAFACARTLHYDASVAEDGVVSILHPTKIAVTLAPPGSCQRATQAPQAILCPMGFGVAPCPLGDGATRCRSTRSVPSCTKSPPRVGCTLNGRTVRCTCA